MKNKDIDTVPPIPVNKSHKVAKTSLIVESPVHKEIVAPTNSKRVPREIRPVKLQQIQIGQKI